MSAMAWLAMITGAALLMLAGFTWATQRTRRQQEAEIRRRIR